MFRRFGCSLTALALVACAPHVRPVKPAQEHSGQPNSSIERAVPSEPTHHAPDVEGAQPPQLEGGQGALAGEASSAQAQAQSQGKDSDAVQPLSRSLPHLESFYGALDALRSGQRQTPVRVMWLGDSHTAADFMTQPIRARLNEAVAPGGPGFVRLGLGGYRHGAVRFKVSGRFRKAPILPAQRTRVLDGVFGYGGIRTLPASGGKVTATLRSPGGGDVTWTLSYRLPKGAGLEVRLGEQVTRLTAATESEQWQKVQSTVFVGSSDAPFSIRHLSGDPQVFGAFVESSSAGAVLDTVGINGARAATPLAWEPEQFALELRRRAPELLVLAFGTNEVFDNTRPSRYVEHFRQLLARARAVNPKIPCWIVGPPDSATSEGRSKARVAQVTAAQRDAAEEGGCAFTSAFELMGGEGSYTAWRKERPAKARGDRIHLTILGYETLGERLADELLPWTPSE